MPDRCRTEGCRQQNHREVDEVWDRRPVDGVSKAEYEAAASRLGGIDAAHSHTATACNERHPCYGCCIRARAALEAAAGVKISSYLGQERDGS